MYQELEENVRQKILVELRAGRYTQRDLARVSGIPYTTLHYWISGVRTLTQGLDRLDNVTHASAMLQEEGHE